MSRFRFLAALTAAVIAGSAAAAQWEARPGGGDRIFVHVFKKGAFSAFAHDHHFEVTQWRATADVPDGEPSSPSVEVVVSADSMRDRQQSLSEENRRKVDQQAAGAEVLDAQHHPRIEFRSQRFEADPGGTPGHVRGSLHGTLTIRGQSVPAAVAVDADRGGGVWRVRGKARVKQTAFGIKPFSGFAGTVGVKDELEIELALTLRPRRG
jgi:polyisoprenoid-binding protein YceI